ncbi:MAG: peroxiredoxin-like family protein [Dokdonella sp.]
MIRIILASLLMFSSPLFAANEIAASATEVHPLLLGSEVPDVALKTLDGKETSLRKQMAGKPAILVFYRGGWCPYCNTQLSDLRLIAKDIDALGYQIIAISPDRPEELAKTLSKDKLDYTLLSDSKADALKAFGIAYRVDDETIKKYQGYGIDLEKSSGETHHVLPVPSVFIVDTDNLLQFSYTHPDYRVRVPGSVILAAAKAIAHHEQMVKPKR